MTMNGSPQADSLDKVELIMAMEEELQIEISDAFAGRWNLLTFQDLVEHVHLKHNPPARRNADRKAGLP